MGHSDSYERQREQRLQLCAIGLCLLVVGFGVIGWAGWNIFAILTHRHPGPGEEPQKDENGQAVRTANRLMPHGVVAAVGFLLVMFGNEIIGRNRGPRNVSPRW